ncbi:hypothetical protein [Salinimonas iocasae]|uniref:Uncharacterized protein n=1 Tax=Salinimonas iocasae TaxID=2572577 RepID=A0A5B7YIL2_9ALTE|nr:hypothetical protein [Salinimonas iocasae]QCZ95296.1 hypothetical protein FBQ74_17260 [Salinimonas iocasae]
MLHKLSKLLKTKDRTAKPASENLPYVWDIYCMNGVNAMFPNAPENMVLCPPFFRAKELPTMKNRIKEAVHYYSPVMLYNTLVFEGAPKDEELFSALTTFESTLRQADRVNPWINHLRTASLAKSKLGDYTQELPEMTKVELNLARPMYEELVGEPIKNISAWFYKNWDKHKDWALTQ